MHIQPSNIQFTPVEQLSYEQAFSELEKIVAMLEANDQNLTEAQALFQRGQELAKFCTMQLDQADLVVQQITGDQLEAYTGE